MTWTVGGVLVPSLPPVAFPQLQIMPHMLGGASSAVSPADFAAVALRHAPSILFVLCLLHLCESAAAASASSAEIESEADDERCSRSMGFNESSGAKDRNAQDLNFCNEHHKRTCCERENTKEVLNWFAMFSQRQSPRCVQMSRLALCSVCDGDVGVGLKSEQANVVMCPLFCKRWYDACQDDFFAASGTGLQPCGAGSLVCSPLGEIHENSAAFCSRVATSASGGGSFVVSESEDEHETPCFDGVPAAKVRGKGPKAPYTRPRRQVSWQVWAEQQLKRVAWAMRIPPWFQQYIPGLIVASIAVLFVIYFWTTD